LVEENIQAGNIVEIPLREKKFLAIVLNISKDENINFEKEKIKDILKKK
jgi:primosomal protein N'